MMIPHTFVTGKSSFLFLFLLPSGFLREKKHLIKSVPKIRPANLSKSEKKSATFYSMKMFAISITYFPTSNFCPEKSSLLGHFLFLFLNLSTIKIHQKVWKQMLVKPHNYNFSILLSKQN